MSITLQLPVAPRWRSCREFAAWWRDGNTIDVLAMATWHKGAPCVQQPRGVNLPDELLPEWNAMSFEARTVLLAYARREAVPPLVQR